MSSTEVIGPRRVASRTRNRRAESRHPFQCTESLQCSGETSSVIPLSSSGSIRSSAHPAVLQARVATKPARGEASQSCHGPTRKHGTAGANWPATSPVPNPVS